jgi:hypothetical protein
VKLGHAAGRAQSHTRQAADGSSDMSVSMRRHRPAAPAASCCSHVAELGSHASSRSSAAGRLGEWCMAAGWRLPPRVRRAARAPASCWCCLRRHCLAAAAACCCPALHHGDASRGGRRIAPREVAEARRSSAAYSKVWSPRGSVGARSE